MFRWRCHVDSQAGRTSVISARGKELSFARNVVESCEIDKGGGSQATLNRDGRTALSGRDGQMDTRAVPLGS